MWENTSLSLTGLIRGSSRRRRLGFLRLLQKVNAIIVHFIISVTGALILSSQCLLGASNGSIRFCGVGRNERGAVDNLEER